MYYRNRIIVFVGFLTLCGTSSFLFGQGNPSPYPTSHVVLGQAHNHASTHRQNRSPSLLDRTKSLFGIGEKPNASPHGNSQNASQQNAHNHTHNHGTASANTTSNPHSQNAAQNPSTAARMSNPNPSPSASTPSNSSASRYSSNLTRSSTFTPEVGTNRIAVNPDRSNSTVADTETTEERLSRLRKSTLENTERERQKALERAKNPPVSGLSSLGNEDRSTQGAGISTSGKNRKKNSTPEEIDESIFERDNEKTSSQTAERTNGKLTTSPRIALPSIDEEEQSNRKTAVKSNASGRSHDLIESGEQYPPKRTIERKTTAESVKKSQNEELPVKSRIASNEVRPKNTVPKSEIRVPTPSNRKPAPPIEDEFEDEDDEFTDEEEEGEPVSRKRINTVKEIDPDEMEDEYYAEEEIFTSEDYYEEIEEESDIEVIEPTPTPRRNTAAQRRKPVEEKVEEEAPEIDVIVVKKEEEKPLVAILEVEMNGPKKRVVGQESPYQFKIRNRGGAPAEQVILSVEMPVWAEVQSTDFNVGTTTFAEKTSEIYVLNWTFDILEAGEEQLLTVHLIPRQRKTLSMSWDYHFKQPVSQTVIDVLEPHLELSLEGPQEMLWGTEEAFRLRIQNTGNGDAEDLQLTLISSETDPSETVSESMGTLKAGQEKVLIVKAFAKHQEKMKISVHASGPFGLEAETSREITILRPKLHTIVEAPEMQFVGNENEYRIIVQNQGTAPAENVVIKAVLPSGVKYVSNQGKGRVLPTTQNQILWNIDRIPVEEEYVCVLVCELKREGTCKLDVSASEKSGLSSTTSATTSVESVADLAMKIENPSGPVEVGKVATHTIRIINRGTKPAEKVDIIAVFTEGVIPINVSGAKATIFDNPEDERCGQVYFDTIPVVGDRQPVELKIQAKSNAPGNHKIRVEMICDSTGTYLINEDSTHYYSKQRGYAPGSRNSAKEMKEERDSPQGSATRRLSVNSRENQRPAVKEESIEQGNSGAGTTRSLSPRGMMRNSDSTENPVRSPRSTREYPEMEQDEMYYPDSASESLSGESVPKRISSSGSVSGTSPLNTTRSLSRTTVKSQEIGSEDSREGNATFAPAGRKTEPSFTGSPQNRPLPQEETKKDAESKEKNLKAESEAESEDLEPFEDELYLEDFDFEPLEEENL